MKKKNKRLAIILLILLLVNISFLMIEEESSSVSFDEDLFVLEDTASINSISIQYPEESLEIKRSGGGWMVNDEFPVDEGLKRLFFSIMQRVRVKKPVKAEVPDEATMIRVSGDNPLSFYVWGNPTKTKTFFSLEGREKVYEVGIPGYHEYLGQIFDLNKDQWRDRLVFDGSWRTIQELSLDYSQSDENDFNIKFVDSFFEVDGVNQIDSSAVVDYLNQFQYFEVNEWVSQGRFDRYDSLSRKPPVATLTILTIDLDEPVVFDIYPRIKNEPIHLVSNKNDRLMVIDRTRILNILRERDDFIAED